MAIGRGKLEKLLRNELKKSPKKGRKKVSKKKTSKKDIESNIAGLFGGTGGGRGEPKELPESINVPGIGEIKPPRQKRKTKAKKADAKPNIGRPKKVKGGKKRPTKVRVTEAKPKVREDIQIDIPEIINIPGIGQIELPKAKPKPKPKAEPKPDPKPEPKAEEESREEMSEEQSEMFSFTQAMIGMVDMMDSHEALKSYWEDPENISKIEVLENNYPKYFKTLKEVFVRKYEDIEQGAAKKEKSNA